MSFATYLPDELLLEILEYIEAWEIHERQSSLARFCCVNRQWYDVGIRKLYEAPYLSGRAYERFVRTICPSVIPRIRPSSLSGLVRVLDLSHIVHNSNKATTASAWYPHRTALYLPCIPKISVVSSANKLLYRITRANEELVTNLHRPPSLLRHKLLGLVIEMHTPPYPRPLPRLRSHILPIPQPNHPPTTPARRTLPPALQFVL
jgi:hypothetical protein